MLNRPTRVQTYTDIAAIWAKRSTCMRRNVGAIIVKDRHIISHGYNGTPPGHDHCSGNICSGRQLCELTTHAEENAITHVLHLDSVLYHGATSPLENTDIYTTDSPCLKCAKLIEDSGIRRVFFAIPYRDVAPLVWLSEHDILVYQVMPAGYVIDYFTRDLVEVGT